MNDQINKTYRNNGIQPIALDTFPKPITLSAGESVTVKPTKNGWEVYEQDQ